MPNKYFSVLILLITVSSFSQNVTVKWGTETEFEKRTKISAILSDNDGYFYIIKQSTKKNKNGFVLEKFSAAGVSIEKKAEINLPQTAGRTTRFEDILVIGNRIWMFWSQYDETALKQYLYAGEISKNLEYNGIPVEADKIENVSSRNRQEFILTESEDGKNVLISHNLPFERYNNEKFSYKVFNDSMKPVWGKELELPYKDQFLKISRLVLDNESNVHLLSSVTEERKKGESNDRSAPNNNYYLITYLWKENKLKEFDITLGDKWISAVSFGMAPNGDMVAGGFYSNTHEQTLAGTFYLRIENKTQKIVSKNLKAFEKDFMREFLPEKKVKKGKELSDFYFDHFIIRDDGSALFVAEQYYMQIVYNYNDPYGYNPYGMIGYSPYYARSTYNYQYYYNDLVVVSVTSEGVIEWAKKIPKRQVSSNDMGYYLSYALAHNSNGIYILFNDNEKNTPQWRNAGNNIYSMMKPKKSVATLVFIGKNGMVNYSSLFSAKDSKQVLRPKMHFQPDTKSLVIFSQKGKTYKFGILSLE